MLSQEKQISYLANLISNYRDKMKQVIEKLKEKALNKGVQLFFIDEVENISFKAVDIANNCTNLNGNAQKKVADQVLQSLNKS